MEVLSTMQATGWNNGKWLASGAGYGIRISCSDRDRYFDEKWSAVEIERELSAWLGNRPHAVLRETLARNKAATTTPGVS